MEILDFYHGNHLIMGISGSDKRVKERNIGKVAKKENAREKRNYEWLIVNDEKELSNEELAELQLSERSIFYPCLSVFIRC